MASVSGSFEDANTNTSPQVDTNKENETDLQKNEAYDATWLKGTSADHSPKVTCNKSAHNVRSDFSAPEYKTLSRINGKINSMPMNALVNSLMDLKLDTGGKKEVLIRRLKNYHKEKTLKEGVPPMYDYVCVIDYEATCTENSLGYPHEIIEFPVVLVNMKTLTIDAHFQAYCKPRINPKLTHFCKTLTGITQEQVDTAEHFPSVLDKVNNWFLTHGLGRDYSFAIAADGPWDMQKFLYMQCGHSDVGYPAWAYSWIDVRKLFSNWFGIRRLGIEMMLNYLGLEFEGNQHCGLDDSRNIAKILLRLVTDGCTVKTNSRIKDNMNIISSRNDGGNI